MNQYTLVQNYFTQENNSLEPVFNVFLNVAALKCKESGIQAQFICGRVIPLIENNQVLSWIELLRAKRDSSHLPVLAYALAGDIPMGRFSWLLTTLGKETIQSYQNLPWSLIMIAAAFGSVERLEMLLEQYDETDKRIEAELKDGLFYATYHGHVEMFKYIKKIINAKMDILHENNNSLLHVAVIGGNSAMIDYIAENSNLLEIPNLQQRRAIDEAVIAGNLELVKHLKVIHSTRKTPINFVVLMDVLVQEKMFTMEQEEIFNYLYENCSPSETTLINWINNASKVGNSGIVDALRRHLPKGVKAEMFSINTNDHSQEKIAYHLDEVDHFNQWIEEVHNNILYRLMEYINRSSDTKELDRLAIDDKMPVGRYKSSNANFKNERIKTATSFTETFFYTSYFEKFKAIYLDEVSMLDKDNGALFSGKIILNRQALVGEIKNKSFERFEQELQQAFFGRNNPAPEMDNWSSDLKMSASDRPQESTVNVAQVTLPEMSQKTKCFIETFATEFEKTCRFYMCISSGDVLKKPDGIDKLAEISKKAAEILPNFSISAASLGLPIPLKMDFPSSAAVAAVIDVCLFIRNSNQQHQANRINDLFENTTLQHRNDMIYGCARSRAKRFQDQIHVLHINNIPFFAKLTVARLFSYMLKSPSSTQSGPSTLFTALRKLMSNFIEVGPEPENIHMSLNEVADAAISAHQHLVIYKNKEEERLLMLDSSYTNTDIDSPDRQWTAKGIFEHSGIREEDGTTYSFSNDDARKYGYLNATKDEADRRTMKKQKNAEKPWYVENGASIQPVEIKRPESSILARLSTFTLRSSQTVQRNTEEKAWFSSKR